MTVKNKICLVTGAAGGIGQATAELLSDRGATVSAVDTDDRRAGELVARLGGPERARFLRADLTSAEDLDRIVGDTVSTYSRIDVLAHCAGIGSLTKIPDLTESEWDKMFAVNLKSVFFLTQRVITHMIAQKSGTIVTLSSASAKMGGKAVGPHYSASKAGVICLTKSLAHYGAQFGITANSVCPGPTVTPMTDEWGETLNKEFASAIPLKRYATPTEVAEAICFLASDGAAYITGETIDVNGGFVMD